MISVFFLLIVKQFFKMKYKARLFPWCDKRLMWQNSS